MRGVRQIGRRAWLTQAGAGLVAVWAGLSTARREAWGVLLGQPSTAEAAQPAAPQIFDALITPEFPGLGPFPIRAFVVVRGREVAIVDSLLPGNVAAIEGALRTAGLGFDAVKHLILTHWHTDHAGTAEDIAARASGATIYAGAPDIPQLMAGSAQQNLPPLRRQVRPVADGDEVFGLRIVATPGHTAGHICVLDPVGSTVMTGDAVFNANGVMTGSPPPFTADLVQAGQSLRKLAGMDFQRVLFAHGDTIASGGSGAIGQFLERYPRASDGQSLEHQSFATQAAFAAIHGAQAGAAWVRQHEAELARGIHRPLEASPHACCPHEQLA